jgi:hypothetical protein
MHSPPSRYAQVRRLVHAGAHKRGPQHAAGDASASPDGKHGPPAPEETIAVGSLVRLLSLTQSSFECPC